MSLPCMPSICKLEAVAQQSEDAACQPLNLASTLPVKVAWTKLRNQLGASRCSKGWITHDSFYVSLIQVAAL